MNFLLLSMLIHQVRVIQICYPSLLAMLFDVNRSHNYGNDILSSMRDLSPTKTGRGVLIHESENAINIGLKLNQYL